MMNNDTTDFLVIGAGLAGLTCAGDLRATGATVRLLDKGRGVGGRMATRRMEADGVSARVDHGAQFFTARGERLLSLVQMGLDEGWLTTWTHGFPLWKDGTIHERPAGHPRYVPRVGMNDLAKRLAVGLDVVTSATVVRIERQNDSYTVTTEDGRTFSGKTLILNLPPVQLLALARNLLSSATISQLETVRFLPAWTLMALLSQDVANVDWSALEFEEHPVLGWISRDHSKRGGEATPALVVHGSGAWSAKHLEDATEQVAIALRSAAEEVVGSLPIKVLQIHRWRYALPVAPLTDKFLWDRDTQIGCCGDWCGGPRVEGALESGWHLAAELRR